MSKTEEYQTRMKKKVDKVRTRRYIEPGNMLSLSYMFYVCIGLNYIRMIYNETLCGLNLTIWGKKNGLTIFQHIIRALLPGYSKCDMNVVELL